MEPLPVNRARRYHIATYRSIQQTVERGEIDMLIVSWVYFSGKDRAQEADGFCGAGEDAFGDLVDSLCEAGFETEIVGRGSGKVVVFHKRDGTPQLDGAKARRAPFEIDSRCRGCFTERWKRASYWFDRAYAERDDRLTYIAVDPLFISFREDSSFEDLLRRMNFPE